MNYVVVEIDGADGECRMIDRFPDYAVCENGSMWSKKYGRWKRLKATINNNGYPVVGLYKKDGSHRVWGVHQIVCEAFNGPCPPGLQCRHLDGVPSNCHYKNLKWGTGKENADDRFRHGRSFRGETHPMSELTEAQVIDIRKRLEAGERHVDIAPDYGVHRSLISHIAHGRIWDHLGGPIATKKRCKLSTEQATEIIRRHRNGERQADLVREFRVSPATVCQLVNGTHHRRDLAGDLSVA